MDWTPKITLEYQRAGSLFSGRLVVHRDLASSEVLPFERACFEWMFLRLADSLRELPHADVVVSRTDREGLVPMPLDRRLVSELVQRPEETITALANPVGGPSHVRGETVACQPPPSPVLTGVEAQAEEFGEHVFVRVRRSQLECPGCGFWSPLPEEGTLFRCRKACRIELSTSVLDRWATIAVEQLLASKAPSFFLPRMWNPSGLWISHSALQAKHATYRTSMETAPCSPPRDRPDT